MWEWEEGRVGVNHADVCIRFLKIMKAIVSCNLHFLKYVHPKEVTWWTRLLIYMYLFHS